MEQTLQMPDAPFYRLQLQPSRRHLAKTRQRTASPSGSLENYLLAGLVADAQPLGKSQAEACRGYASLEVGVLRD